MNKAQRDKVKKLIDDLEALQGSRSEVLGEIEALREEEQEKFDNLTEGLQTAPNGEAMEAAINLFEEAESSLSAVENYIQEAIDNLASVE